jgi:putative oxidoreductase
LAASLLYNGINHFKQGRTLVKYVIEKKVLAPQLAVTASGVVLVLGGASILLGIKPKFGTAVVAGFLAAVSPIMHDFWHMNDPGQRTT